MAEKQPTAAELVERIRKGLKCSEEEAIEILEYDKQVERGAKTEYDLPPDKLKVAQKFAHTGTRKAPPAYKFTQRQRKPNVTKAGLVTNLAEFLEKMCDYAVENVEIVNKERQIAFSIGGEKFELTLVQKRKPK